MSSACPTEYIEFADELARLSGEVLTRYFRTAVAVDRKADESPVTIADREAETAMRAAIEQHFPDHGIIGEEHADVRLDAPYIWVLDPIDGTRAFITGKPMFGTLIALVQGDAPVLGVIDQPVSGERWVGAAGRPTTFNGRAVSCRPCGALDQATMNSTSPDLFGPADGARFRSLAGHVREVQYGGDCYAYGLLASGYLDLVVEADLKPHDYCALAPVVNGAGGAMTDWSGAPLRLGSDGRVVAVGDPGLLNGSVAVLTATD